MLTRRSHSKRTSDVLQPKPTESSKAALNRDAYTKSFLGIHPRMTQVPPSRDCSANTTRAPCEAATQAARRPPDPPPITKRSMSACAMDCGIRETNLLKGWQSIAMDRLVRPESESESPTDARAAALDAL